MANMDANVKQSFICSQILELIKQNSFVLFFELVSSWVFSC